MTSACHLEGFSAPNHANETATATTMNMMVTLGLGQSQTFKFMVQYVNSPPLTIICPCSDDKKQDRLSSETDTVREKDDGIDCETIR